MAIPSQPNDTGQDDTLELSSKKRRIFVLATVIGGLLFGLVIAEIALRVAGYSSPEFYRADDVLGYELIPKMSGTYRKEGTSFVEINADGFRDGEHEIVKPPDVTRIAVIGDSYVEALQVAPEESFTRYVGDAMQDCGGKTVEVLNFGVSGYSTAQELLMLREKVQKYSPDMVMLVMTTNNDISDNSHFFKKSAIPYFVYKNGQLTLDESYRSERAFMFKNSRLSQIGIRLKNNLRVVQAIGEIQVSIKHKYRKWRDQQPMAVPAAITTTETTPSAEVGIDSQIYRPPSDENWENAWNVTEGIIVLMKNEVVSNGAKFVVVTASNGVQVLPDIKERIAFAKLLGVDDLYFPDRRIAEFCRSKSIPVITLAPVLAEYAARENVNLHGFEGNIGYGHWNRLGHHIAGEEIGKRLCQDAALP